MNRTMLALLSGAALALSGCAAATDAGLATAPPPANLAQFDWLTYRGSDPVDAQAKPGPGEFRNPILQGYYPDPSITRVGEDYYLVNSSFAHFPGIPVWHSRDLVNWTQIANAIDRPDQLDFKALGLSRGVFAPAIEHHDGTFYIINTCVDCDGNFVITAKDPRGPWSDPVFLPDLEGGIDPSIFFDADGRAWVLNNGAPVGTPRYDGHRAIWIQQFDAKSLKTFGPRTVLVDGGVDPSKNPVWIEGPHLFKKDGWYYLTAAEGGTAVNHSQVVLRSRRPDGPFTPNPNNPFLTQRDLPDGRPNPITSAGHADLIETQNGEWWAPFLAVRPYSGDLYNIGRETFLMPVTWENGWPVITRPGQVIPWTAKRPNLPPGKPGPLPTNGPFSVRYAFDRPLGMEWVMLRNPRDNWYRVEDGMLKLTPRAVGLGDNGNPSFIARRQQHLDATVETQMLFEPRRDGDRAGLVALQSDDAWLAILLARKDGDRVIRAVVRSSSGDPHDGRILVERPIEVGPIRLRLSVTGGTASLAYAPSGGDWRTLVDNTDATILSTQKAGGFVGTVIGPFAQSGN
ncbi:glycoside hydrolase family 43 protein [Sphingomonas sp. FW199]|uniref:glycoside hydrolase family 43 protein n=1 Tax=Sphingomonas sp. FW199 TaxID=3400217 RepID=UPI003CEF745D